MSKYTVEEAIAAADWVSHMRTPFKGVLEDAARAYAERIKADEGEVPDSMIVLLNHLEGLMDSGILPEDAITVDMWNAVSTRNIAHTPAQAERSGRACDEEVRELVQEYSASTGSFNRVSIAIRIAKKLASLELEDAVLVPREPTPKMMDATWDHEIDAPAAHPTAQPTKLEDAVREVILQLRAYQKLHEEWPHAFPDMELGEEANKLTAALQDNAK